MIKSPETLSSNDMDFTCFLISFLTVRSETGSASCPVALSAAVSVMLSAAISVALSAAISVALSAAVSVMLSAAISVMLFSAAVSVALSAAISVMLFSAAVSVALSAAASVLPTKACCTAAPVLLSAAWSKTAASPPVSAAETFCCPVEGLHPAAEASNKATISNALIINVFFPFLPFFKSITPATLCRVTLPARAFNIHS